MSRTILTRTAALAAAAMLALTACGGTDEAPAEEDPEVGAAEEAEQNEDLEEAEDADDDSDASDAGGAEDEHSEDSEDSENEATDEEGTEDEGSEDGAADGGADEGTVVEIGTELTDEETGDVVTIVSAVRNLPTEYYLDSDNPEGEMIYLEVTVEPGDEFGGTISVRDFYLDDDGQEVNHAASASDELEAAGYTYFDSPSRRDGEFTGYLPIYVETTGDTLSGTYLRPEAQILGEDETIPEFSGEFEIPAA